MKIGSTLGLDIVADFSAISDVEYVPSSSAHRTRGQMYYNEALDHAANDKESERNPYFH